MANRKPIFDELVTSDGVVCPTPDATAELGAQLAAGLPIGSMISLEGPLGAGKTQLVKGLAQGLGCLAPVSSPSFALLHEYPGPHHTLYHFDFYRMETAAELATAGYDDCLADGIVVAEWGNKFPAALPPGTFRLEFEILPGEARRIRAIRTP